HESLGIPPVHADHRLVIADFTAQTWILPVGTGHLLVLALERDPAILASLITRFLGEATKLRIGHRRDGHRKIIVDLYRSNRTFIALRLTALRAHLERAGRDDDHFRAVGAVTEGL